MILADIAVSPATSRYQPSKWEKTMGNGCPAKLGIVGLSSISRWW